MALGHIYDDLNIKLKEDVLDIIFRLTPEETPFTQITGESTAEQPFHQWLREALTTRAANTNDEAAAYSFATAPIAAVREVNVTQILKKEIRVSRSSQKSARYGVADQFADQMAKRMVEFKTDMEHALIQASLVSGNGSTARQLQGLIWALSLGSLQTTTMSSVTFAESHLNDLLEALWNRGASPRDLLTNGTLKRRISGFSASGQKWRDQNDLRLINTVAVYQSDFSEVRVHLSRDVPQALVSLSGQAPGSFVVVVDRTMLKKAFLDRPFARRTPEIADSMDGVILGEVTLEYGHPDAGGWYRGLF